MNGKLFLKIARRLMSVPVAPYYEDQVREEVESICRENGIAFRRDPFGNVIARVKGSGKKRPVVLAAHMDHPGFEVKGWVNERTCRVEFLGGVPPEYFKKGIPLLLQPGNVKARLGKTTGPKKFLAHLQQKLPGKVWFGVWDLIPHEFKNDRIVGRGCDDLVGVATILATLIEVRRKNVHVIGVISRAEEIGFQGALMVMEQKLLPRNSFVISLETSKEIPPIAMGKGVIIRVGDKTSIFDSDGTRFLTEVAKGIARKEASFPYQRALMSGGTCEATAYQEYGYQTAAVCVALGHYHNCAPGKKIAEEFVSLSDALSMVKLLQCVCLEIDDFEKKLAGLDKDLAGLVKVARKRLKR